VTWLPGGAKILFSGQAAPGVYGIWSVETIGGAVRKLQDSGGAAAASPDGKRIAFIRRQEIWTMGANGEAAARVVGATQQEAVSQVAWSPDGRWLTDIRRVDERGAAVLEARVAGGSGARRIFESPDLQSFCWLSSGRLVLNLWEAPDEPTSNLWEMDVEPKGMRAIGRPRRLTNWAGFSVGSMSASADGRRLVFTKRTDQSDVMVGELVDGNSGLVHERHLTTDERIDWPGGWSADSKWLLFESDRTGRMSIFRQRVDSANAAPVVVNAENNWSPALSPDGVWLLYFVSRPSEARLMRVRVAGGAAEEILASEGTPAFVRSSKAPGTAASTHVSTAGNPAFRCPARPGAPCVLSEAVGGEVVFSSFEPGPRAGKTEIFRIATENPSDVFWDLSGDGTRIAYGSRSEYSHIRIRDLAQKTIREISIPQWPELRSAGWAPDGRSLFASHFAPDGSSLLQVTLDGRAKALYKSAEPIELLKASPDGRYLAFGQVVSGVNVWLIEGIPK
jgi:Tol biopolymer transport system component